MQGKFCFGSFVSHFPLQLAHMYVKIKPVCFTKLDDLSMIQVAKMYQLFVEK